MGVRPRTFGLSAGSRNVSFNQTGRLLSYLHISTRLGPTLRDAYSIADFSGGNLSCRQRAASIMLSPYGSKTAPSIMVSSSRALFKKAMIFLAWFRQVKSFLPIQAFPPLGRPPGSLPTTPPPLLSTTRKGHLTHSIRSACSHAMTGLALPTASC